jgi:hypothetical protein
MDKRRRSADAGQSSQHNRKQKGANYLNLEQKNEEYISWILITLYFYMNNKFV